MSRKKVLQIHCDKLVFHLQTLENPFPWYLYRQFSPYKRLKRCLFKRSKVSDTSNQWYKKWSMVFKTRSSLHFSQWHPCCLFRKHLLMNTFFSPAVDSSVSCQKIYFQETYLYNILSSLSWWKLMRHAYAPSFVFDGHSKPVASCCINLQSPPAIDTMSQIPWELWPLCTVLLL